MVDHNVSYGSKHCINYIYFIIIYSWLSSKHNPLPS